jgi:undecaprenyl-diphosphatase
MEVPMLCTWSGVWALTVAIALKQIVGRSEVYPTYIRGRSTAFHWLHGSTAYQAFPSGTTCVAAAVLAVIWIRVPKLRALALLALVLTAAGLVSTNSHWLSDTLAGAFIGGTIGWMTVLLLDRRVAA